MGLGELVTTADAEKIKVMLLWERSIRAKDRKHDTKKINESE